MYQIESNDLDPRPRCVVCTKHTSHVLSYVTKLFEDISIQVRSKWFPKKSVPVCMICRALGDKIPVVDTTDEDRFVGWIDQSNAVFPGTEVVYT